MIGALDDLGFDLGADFGQRQVKDRPGIGTVGKERLQERKHAEEGRQQQDATIAVLNVRRVNDRMQQQALCIYENVPLLALDAFARVKARRIDPRPPFSALFTLWLSMMQAVGPASRSACSRHFS